MQQTPNKPRHASDDTEPAASGDGSAPSPEVVPQVDREVGREVGEHQPQVLHDDVDVVVRLEEPVVVGQLVTVQVAQGRERLLRQVVPALRHCGQPVNQSVS